jgi:iron complex outermembrane receptor protein
VGGLDVTVDGYLINLRDQLVLSENIQASSAPNSTVAADVTRILAPYSVTAARFFINGVRSQAKGIDLVAHYRLNTSGAGTFDLTAAGNVNKIELKRVPSSTAVLNSFPLFARQRQLSLTEGTPGEKVAGTVDWSLRQWGATARVTYYGNVIQPGTSPAADIPTGRHAITDLEVRYTLRRGPSLALGVQNLFDVYPDRVPGNLNAPSGLLGFPFYSPFGFNGRYLYARLGVNF